MKMPTTQFKRKQTLLEKTQNQIPAFVVFVNAEGKISEEQIIKGNL